MARLDPYTPTPAARAGRIVMTVVPFAVALVLVFLSFLPVGRIFGSSVMLALAFIAIYYWAVARPELLPPMAVFAIGLVFDLLSAGPIGLWAFVYLLAYGLTVTQRFFLINAPFSVFWTGFGVVAGIAGLVAWAAASLFFGQALAISPILWHMGMTVALFPLVAVLLTRIQARVLPGT